MTCPELRICWYWQSEPRLGRPALDVASSRPVPLPPVPSEISRLVLESMTCDFPWNLFTSTVTRLYDHVDVSSALVVRHDVPGPFSYAALRKVWDNLGDAKYDGCWEPVESQPQSRNLVIGPHRGAGSDARQGCRAAFRDSPTFLTVGHGDALRHSLR